MGTFKRQSLKLLAVLAVVGGATYYYRMWLFDNVLPLVAPAHMPVLPDVAKNDPIQSPSLSVAIKDSVMRAAADGLVKEGWDFVLADENGWFPRKMVIHLQKIDKFEFTNRGTIHVVLTASPMVIFLISESVKIEKFEVEFIPTVIQNVSTGDFTSLHLQAVVTDFQLAPPEGIKKDSPGLVALQKLIATTLSTIHVGNSDLPGANVPLPKEASSITLPQVSGARGTIAITALKAWTDNHTLFVGATIGDRSVRH